MSSGQVSSSRRYPASTPRTPAYRSLRTELTGASLTDVAVTGVEGPAWPALVAIEAHTGETLAGSSRLASALAAARLTESDPGLAPVSSHLLAFGRRP